MADEEVPIRFTCGYCRAELEIDSDQAGKPFTCPECLRTGIAPSPSAAGSAALTAVDTPPADVLDSAELPAVTDQLPDGAEPRGGVISMEKDASAGDDSGTTWEPTAIERSEQSGRRYLLFACSCGKRIRFPADTGRKKGRCPSCGKRHRIPDKYLLPPPRARRAAAIKQPSAVPEVMEILNASRSSLEHTAWKLREKALETGSPPDLSEFGLVTAWPRADRFERTIAGLIDAAGILIIAVLVLSGLKAIGVSGIPRLIGITGIVALAAGISADAAGTFRAGGSPGKLLMGIRVRSAADGGKPDGKTILVRILCKWPLGILTSHRVFTDPKGRTLHDRISGTRVLRAPRRR